MDDDTGLRRAAIAATFSKDTTPVGAFLVGWGGAFFIAGFNHIVDRVKRTPERTEAPNKYLWTAHAEQSIIAHAARNGYTLRNATLFVTHCPCASCARSIIEAGIARVVYRPGRFAVGSPIALELETSRTMFREAGIEAVEK